VGFVGFSEEVSTTSAITFFTGTLTGGLFDVGRFELDNHWVRLANFLTGLKISANCS
jgi:hypothetical protein